MAASFELAGEVQVISSASWKLAATVTNSLPALGSAVPLRPLVALLDCETSGSLGVNCGHCGVPIPPIHNRKVFFIPHLHRVGLQ